MAELYSAKMPDPSPSAYGGAILEAPRQDQSTQMLVGGIGSIAIEAYKGKERADLTFDLASLEKQTQAANEVLLEGGPSDVALTKFSDKMKNLDAGVFSGSLSPSEYKIKRELILKEHTKNMPGLAADFQQIYRSTSEDKTAEQFAMRKVMDSQAQAERERQQKLQDMRYQFIKENGGNMLKYMDGTAEDRAVEELKVSRFVESKQVVNEAEQAVKTAQAQGFLLGEKLVNDYLGGFVVTAQQGAAKEITSMLGQFNTGAELGQGNPDKDLFDFAYQAGSRMTVQQKVQAKKGLEALRDSAVSKMERTFMAAGNVPEVKMKAAINAVKLRYDNAMLSLDNEAFAKAAKQQVDIEQSMVLLKLRQDDPALADSLTLLKEARLPEVFVQAEVGSKLRKRIQSAGLSQLAPAEGTNPYVEVGKNIDPGGKVGVAANNLNTLNRMVSEGVKGPLLAKAAQAYMQLPDDPNMLNMKTIESYLTLLNNPKLGDLMQDHPTFTDKVMGNVGYILENKMKPFIRDQVSSLITENTRLVQGADSIIFEGENAAKLNKVAGLLNNTVSSVSKIVGEKAEGYKNRQRLMKQDVQSIIDELRQPAKVEEKTSTWFSNFLNSIDPTAEVSLGDVLGATTKGGVAAARAVAKGVDILTSPDVTDFVDAATAATVYALRPESMVKELLVKSKEFATWWHEASKEQRDAFIERSKPKNQEAK